MKILGIMGSPRLKGNTDLLLDEALRGAKSRQAEVEKIVVDKMKITPCREYYGCLKDGNCVIRDDMDIIIPKLLEADGIIFGTPVHLYNMAAQCKTIIDRTTALRNPERSLTNKVGGIVVVSGSLGGISAVKDLYFYMASRRMLPVNYIAAYGLNKGDVRNLEQCMKATRYLGRLMVAGVKMNFRFMLSIDVD